jgi:phosphoribosyl-AMP cyclohydrolase
MELLDAIDFAKGHGLVTAIAQDASSGEILMVAHMNPESLRKTLETGEAFYWSRARGLWHKGEESGNTQLVRELRIDCDGDAVLLRVEQRGGAACHTGKRSCFFRRRDGAEWTDDGTRMFDPEKVYGKRK